MSTPTRPAGDEVYSTLVREAVQEIAEYVRTHECDEFVLKVEIKVMIEAFQELRDGAFSVLEFAARRVVARFENTPNLADNKLKILLRSLSLKLS